MPSPSAQKILQVAGDVLQLALGNTGVGQPADVTAVFSMTGTFQNALVAVEGVPLGQPITQPGTAGPFSQVSPANPSEWVPISEISVFSGALLSSPLTLSSVGGLGTGFAFSVGCAIFQAVQLRLISVGSGAIQGGIATLPFPLGRGLIQQVTGTVNVNFPVTAGGGQVPAPTVPLEANGLVIGPLVDQQREDGIFSGAALVSDKDANRQREMMILELVRIRAGIEEISGKDLQGEIPDYEEAVSRVQN